MSEFHNFEVCRSILESLEVGLCVVDTSNKVVFWSAGAERMTGHLRHEVIGHSCVSETLLPCDQPGCKSCRGNCPMGKAIKSSHPTEATGTLHHKAGHEVPVSIRAVPVHNAHGSIIGAVETFEDHQEIEVPEDREAGLKMAGCVDEVTGVCSHAMMQSHLRETLGTFGEVHVPFAVLCFRLEGLTRFRANFGLQAESMLLRVIAQTLQGALWKTDFVGRWGDDQFLVILNACKEDALASVRERIKRMLALDSIDWWGEKRSLPVSIGQATARLGDTAVGLLERAEESLDASVEALAASAGGNRSAGSK
jgi:diguanylate cyclase (GGDEF)-like protein/PAS domain S-box-containing protein